MNLEPENPNDTSKIVNYLQKEKVIVPCQYKIMLIYVVYINLFLSLTMQENSKLLLRYHCIVKRRSGDNRKQINKNLEIPCSIRAQTF